jgi:hypothetical protein
MSAPKQDGPPTFFPDHGTFYREGQHDFDRSPPEERLAQGKRTNAGFQFARQFGKRPGPEDNKLIEWVVRTQMPQLTSEITNWDIPKLEVFVAILLARERQQHGSVPLTGFALELSKLPMGVIKSVVEKAMK